MKKNEQGYILCFKEGVDTTKPNHLQKFERKERWMSPAFVNNKTMLAEMGWKVVEDEMPVLAPSIAAALSELPIDNDIIITGTSKEINTQDVYDHIQEIVSEMPEQSDVKINLPETFDVNAPVNEKVKRPRIKKPKKRAYNRKPKTEIAHAD